MKQPNMWTGRDVFVLTPDEKRAAACVIGAFLLGLATMHYRARHPRTPPAPTATEQREAKRGVARVRAPRGTPNPRPAAAAIERDRSSAQDPGDDE